MRADEADAEEAADAADESEATNPASDIGETPTPKNDHELPEVTPNDTSAQGYVDMYLDLIWDWNHVINVRLHKATKSSRLIPTTGMSDMMLMHHECDKCWSMHGTKWVPDGKLKNIVGEDGAMTKKHIEYFYMMHLRDVEVDGFYYIVDACLRAKTKSCASDLVVFAIKTAKPWFHTLGEGYFGLAPGKGYDNDQSSSLLYQIYNNGMISSKIFGVHTHMFNSTQDPS